YSALSEGPLLFLAIRIDHVQNHFSVRQLQTVCASEHRSLGFQSRNIGERAISSGCDSEGVKYHPIYCQAEEFLHPEEITERHIDSNYRILDSKLSRGVSCIKAPTSIRSGDPENSRTLYLLFAAVHKAVLYSTRPYHHLKKSEPSRASKALPSLQSITIDRGAYTSGIVLRHLTEGEKTLEKLPASEEGNASKQALDKALWELTSDPLFPQGLPQLSFAALAESRKMLLGNLLQAVNLRENHLSSILTVACEIDSSDLGDNSKPSVSSNGVYRSAGNVLEVAQKTDIPLSIDKQSDILKKQAEVLVSPCNRTLEKDSEGEFQKMKLGIKSIHHGCGGGSKKITDIQISDYVIQEITERHAAVTCISTLEVGLKVLADSVVQKKEVRSEYQIWEENTNSASTS
ncbi:hypothetical protein KI387_001685, partial [Taxus chinensis]